MNFDYRILGLTQSERIILDILKSRDLVTLTTISKMVSTTTATVKTAISKLRSKIEVAGWTINFRRGQGYYLHYIGEDLETAHLQKTFQRKDYDPTDIRDWKPERLSEDEDPLLTALRREHA